MNEVSLHMAQLIHGWVVGRLWVTLRNFLFLQPSSFRGLATPWTSCLHLPLPSMSKSILSTEECCPSMWFLVCLFYDIQVLFLALSASPGSLHYLSQHVQNMITSLPSQIPKDFLTLQLSPVPSHSYALQSITHVVSGKFLAFQKLVSFFHLLLGVSNSRNHKLLQAILIDYYLTKRPRPTQPGHPCMGWQISTIDGWRVLHNSKICYRNSWPAQRTLI